MRKISRRTSSFGLVVLVAPALLAGESMAANVVAESTAAATATAKTRLASHAIQAEKVRGKARTKPTELAHYVLEPDPKACFANLPTWASSVELTVQISVFDDGSSAATSAELPLPQASVTGTIVGGDLNHDGVLDVEDARDYRHQWMSFIGESPGAFLSR